MFSSIPSVVESAIPLPIALFVHLLQKPVALNAHATAPKTITFIINACSLNYYSYYYMSYLISIIKLTVVL